MKIYAFLKSVLIVLLLLLLTKNFYGQAYNIDIHIKGISDTSVILGYHMDGKYLVKDTADLDKKGKGAFTGHESLARGLYFIFLPDQRLLELLIGDDQNFSLSTTYENPKEDIKFSGCDINTVFYHYDTFLKSRREEINKLAQERENIKKNNQSSEKLNEIDNQIKNITKEVENKHIALSSEHQRTILATFLNATRQVEVPDYDSIVHKGLTEYEFKYHYYKNHYFDYFDFSDDGILRTPFFRKKLIDFFDKVILQDPDTLIKESERIIEKAKKNDEVYKYVLGTLYNHYNSSKIMGQDALFVHLAEYYTRGEAPWAGKDFIKKVEERVAKLKNNLIGQTASNFKVLTDDHKLLELHKLKAPYILLVFYDVACSHCKKEVPALFQVVDRLYDKGVGGIGFYTQADTVKWKNFINKENLDWVNVWSPFSNEYRRDYNAYEVPKVYLLDKDKKIIAKQVDHNQFEEIAMQYLLQDLIEEVDSKNQEMVMRTYKIYLAGFGKDEDSLKKAKKIVFRNKLTDKEKEELEQVIDILTQQLERADKN
jgi:peroxiredoxin